MGTYIVGGVVLFAIGFISYEIYEAAMKVSAAAKTTEDALNDAKKTYTAYAPSTSTTTEAFLLSNPLTMPLAAAYGIYEGI